MENGIGLHMREEFASLDFNSKRLERRFMKTMETLAGQPDKSIWFSSENRAEAKAIYRMLGNEELDRGEIWRREAGGGMCGEMSWDASAAGPARLDFVGVLRIVSLCRRPSA